MYKKCWFKKYFFIWNNDYQGPINFFLYFSFSYHWNTHHLVKLCYFKKEILVEKKKFTPLGPVFVIITSFILKLNHLFKSISTPKRRVFFYRQTFLWVFNGSPRQTKWKGLFEQLVNVILQKFYDLKTVLLF